MPSGIARICNDARAAKARFYVVHSVEHCTSASQAKRVGYGQMWRGAGHLPSWRQPFAFARTSTCNRVGRSGRQRYRHVTAAGS